MLFASSDTHEVLGLSDRIGTFFHGRLVGLAPAQTMTAESVTRAVTHPRSRGLIPCTDIRIRRRPASLRTRHLALRRALGRRRIAPPDGGRGPLHAVLLTVGNGLVIVRAASMTGIVAVAMSFVTLSGNLFALSASALGAFLAVVFALVTAAAGLGAGSARSWSSPWLRGRCRASP